jgi:hypothetical protein
VKPLLLTTLMARRMGLLGDDTHQQLPTAAPQLRRHGGGELAALAGNHSDSDSGAPADVSYTYTYYISIGSTWDPYGPQPAATTYSMSTDLLTWTDRPQGVPYAPRYEQAVLDIGQAQLFLCGGFAGPANAGQYLEVWNAVPTAAPAGALPTLTSLTTPSGTPTTSPAPSQSPSRSPDASSSPSASPSASASVTASVSVSPTPTPAPSSCPAGRFGAGCSGVCPGITGSGAVCSGHGTCDGNGYDTGSGVCTCAPGYSGAACSESAGGQDVVVGASAGGAAVALLCCALGCRRLLLLRRRSQPADNDVGFSYNGGGGHSQADYADASHNPLEENLLGFDESGGPGVGDADGKAAKNATGSDWGAAKAAPAREPSFMSVTGVRTTEPPAWANAERW